MGTPIRFRERSRGLIEQATYTDVFASLTETGTSRQEPRLKFLRGESYVSGFPPSAGYVQVGAGTEFPLLLDNYDQLLEIFYRAKDCIITGRITQTNMSGGPDVVDYIMGGQDYRDPNYHRISGGGGGDPTVLRSWVNNDSYPPPNLTDEAQIWTDTLVLPDPVGDIIALNLSAFYPYGIANGLTTYMNMETFGDVPSEYGPYGQEDGGDWIKDDAELVIAFNGYVAVIDNAGNGDPTDPLNDLWVGVHVGGGASDPSFLYPIIFNSTSPDYETGGSPPDSGYQITDGFKIVLSNNQELTMDLWGGWSYYTNAGQLQIRVTDWWTFAHDSGDPMWDNDEGKFIPQDGGGANFENEATLPAL